MSKNFWLSIVMLIVSIPTFAGGYLTNTNQNIVFLRNLARDGAIGIDGVYSNPAGVIFLPQGFHLSLNIQNAHQTRTVLTDFQLFENNANNPGKTLHKFKGVADAPVIPSIQAAWNKGDWSFQFGFAIVGGGGKCEFDEGLGSFEQVVSSMPFTPVNVGNASYPIMNLMNQLYGGLGQVNPAMAGHQMGKGYSYDSYMRGRQYYYGFTLGAARKINDNLSVYGGLRMLYGSSNYYGYVKNIQVEHIENGVSSMVNGSKHFTEQAALFNQYAGALEAMGMTKEAAQLKQGAALSTGLANATQDIELNCDQTGWGVAPIIGIDYHTEKFNLAAKYEFKTRMRLKNKSANSISAEGIAMLDKFKDGNKVPEDSPALLTIGAQYSPIKNLRINAGYHHYFDVDTKQWTKGEMDDSNEYLFGVEYDINKMFEVSAGGQLTRFGQNDNHMNDISFNINSYSFGFGLGVHLNKNITLNLAYFQTNYEDYDKQSEVGTMKMANTFTRTNRVLGVGVDFTF